MTTSFFCDFRFYDYPYTIVNTRSLKTQNYIWKWPRNLLGFM